MTKKWLENLTKNVRQKREALGISQEALAYKCKVSKSTISNIEAGRTMDMKLSMLESIGKGFKESDPLTLLKK